MSIMPDPLTDVMNVEGARPSPVHPWDQQSVHLFSSGLFSTTVPKPLWLHSGPGGSHRRKKVSVTEECRCFPGERRALHVTLRAHPRRPQTFVDWVNE